LTFVIRGTIADGGFLMTCASAHHTKCDLIARASRSMSCSPSGSVPYDSHLNV
jgi:hypothetical protein